MSSSIKNFDNTLIAFCHVEKAAGTSLIHVLRRVFFLRYAAVRPFYRGAGHFFSQRDLRVVRRCNPFIRAIGGHSVVPHSDLSQGTTPVKFITQVRDPTARAASQYRYWVERMNMKADPEGFLQHDASRNFQVRKIAGIEDVTLAKDRLRRDFLLAGTVDRFDEFLVLMANKLGLPLSKFTYRKQNIGSAQVRRELPSDFLEQLRERNQLDQQLYDWIDSSLMTEYIDTYSGDFAGDVERFKQLQASANNPTVIATLDSVYRNAYLKPLTGVIRRCNGLPYSGSYAHTAADLSDSG